MSAHARPLSGLRVAVTRPVDDARELSELLEHAGAVTAVVPLTRIVPPLDDAPLRHALGHLDRYDWIIFTSAAAVRAVAPSAARVRLQGRIAVVGPATAAAVHALLGREADVVPARFAAAALVPAMLHQAPLHGLHVLWPRAERPREGLRDALAGAGAVLDDPIAYRTIPDRSAAAALAGMVRRGDIDVITFTAPSAVDCFADAATGSVQCTVAVIGPATAAAARARGLAVHVEPQQPIIPALVAALVRFHDFGSAGT